MAIKQPLEKDIQRNICEYLFDLKHYFGWRQNNTPIFQMDKGKARFRSMPKYSIKGVPDIILMLKDGRIVFIEVKREKGVLSSDQVLFQEKCLKLGFEYLVAKSLDDVIEYGL